MINGSTALGEALPPHFQFVCTAQSDDAMQSRDESVLYMPRIIGKFGCGEEKSMPVLI